MRQISLWLVALVLLAAVLSAGCGERVTGKVVGQPTSSDPLIADEAVFYVRSTYQGPYVLDSVELLKLDTTSLA